jgi:nucleotide-binding universal stress UspA family protein
MLVAIRARIASADHKPISPGYLAELMTLVEMKLPQLVQIVRNTLANRIEPYQETLRDAVCGGCPYQTSSGVCERRLFGECLLSEFLQPVVEGIDACLKEAGGAVCREARATETSNALAKGASMFNRILVGIDDSDSARRGVSLAAELQTRFGSKIALLHAINAPMAYGPEMIEEACELEKVWMERSVELMRSMRSLLPAGAQVEDFIVTGPPADQLVSHAESWKADVVIVGNHNRGQISRFLLGSTADRVVRRSPCPVLVVREPQDAPAESKGTEGASQLARSGTN